MITVIVADNHEITRYGVQCLAATLPEVGNVCVVQNHAELVQTLLRESRAVVVMDYTQFDIHADSELLVLEERFAQVQWLLFSDELSGEFLCRVLLLSQRIGVVMKEGTLAALRTALTDALQGKRHICAAAAGLLQQQHTDADAQKEPLTATEKEILKLLAVGKTTREIATERYVSMHTVMTHRKNIFRKLAVNNVHEACKYAIRTGLIDVAEYYI